MNYLILKISAANRVLSCNSPKQLNEQINMTVCGIR